MVLKNKLTEEGLKTKYDLGIVPTISHHEKIYFIHTARVSFEIWEDISNAPMLPLGFIVDSALLQATADTMTIARHYQTRKKICLRDNDWYNPEDEVVSF